MPVRYARVPSQGLEAALLPGAFLFPLLERRSVNGLRLDVQLRENDAVQLYCGLTSLLEVHLRAGGLVELNAADSYRTQPCARALFRAWRLGETGFGNALAEYLSGVRVDRRWTGKEGAVQAAWADVRSPWTPIDREGVLGYADTAERDAARAFPAVARAYAEVERQRADGDWARLPTPGGEVDQLAVDPEGRLVLLELKDAAGTADKVYYVALQLLQYVHEWATALPGVRTDIERLKAARARLGLSPELPALDGRLRPVVAFTEDAWSAEVRRRFRAVKTVVDRHLPDGVPPLELWCMRSGRPLRLP